MTEMTVAELSKQCFLFLRDTVGVGDHGLVRLLNSDWNDAVYDDELLKLSECMRDYRGKLLTAFMRDLGTSTFPRRMYFNGAAYGEDNMFLEPHGFTLQIPELSGAQKRALYAEMQERLYKNEKLGAREQETPEFDDVGFDKGSRENGGFWWSLNGPVIIGVMQIDRTEARTLFEIFCATRL